MLVLPICAIFVAALFAPLLHRALGARTVWVPGLVPLTSFGCFLGLLPGISAGQPVRWGVEWAPSLGISLSFYADGLSLLFLLVVSLIGAFVVWYAGGYLAGKKDLGRFYLYLLGFMGSMLGLVAADNLVLLFIFWELTSITSYLLIGYYCEQESSRKAALQALLVTGGGGLAMLAGIILLASATEAYEISQILAMPPGEVAAHPAFPWIFGLLLAGAFTKSAQFPFHFWLPNAMAAPAPVSAFLHSATMVKAGVFLLARLFPCLSPSPLWTPVVGTAGAVTMMVGVVLALGQTDLKKILAYTTLAVLGTLTMLLGIGTELAVKAAVTYLLAHALYKAALFMAAGSVDHETGTRDVAALGGLRSVMPFTAAAAILGALSMAGLPFLLGFVSKEYFYKALLDAEGPPFLWESLGLAASVCMVALAATAGLRPFFGKKPAALHAHEAPPSMWIGPLILGILAIKMGIFPGVAGERFVGPAAAAILGDQAFQAHLKLWHGLTTALFMSIATFALGAGLYALSPRIRAARPFYAALARVGPERGYEALLAGLLAAAARITRAIQNGYQRNYVLAVGAFAVAVVVAAMPSWPAWPDLSRMAPMHVPGIVVCALMVAAALFACLARSRFAAIMALGVVGLGVAVIYFLSSAPDLAMTQILVETLTLVLFVLAFYKLPLLSDYSSRAVKLRDGALAVGFGAVMTILVLYAHSFPPGADPISAFMGENSLPLANGRNVVNVILVDFRALDTLGEITVLGIAALGVAAILKLKPK